MGLCNVCVDAIDIVGMTSTTDKSDKEVAEVLLKTDRLGRITVPPETRELLLDRFEASGLSGQIFAARAFERDRQKKKEF